MRRSRSIRRGRPTAPQLAFVERSRRTHGSVDPRPADEQGAQVTRERAAVSGPAWSRDGSQICVPRRSARTTDRPDQARRLPRRRHAGAVTGELGRPTWAPDCRSVGRRRAVSLLGSLPRGAQPGCCSTRSSRGTLVPVGAVSRSIPPATARAAARCGRPTARTWRSSPRAGSGRWRSTARAARSVRRDTIADDQPESPSWEGDSRHIVYQTPNGLRRVLADGSPAGTDRARPDVAGRAPAGAGRGARRTRLRRRPRSARTANPTSWSSAASSAASRATATTCMPARSSMRPGRDGDARPDRDARASGRRVRRQLRPHLARVRDHQRADPVDQPVRGARSSARRSTPAAVPAPACSSPAIRSTAAAIYYPGGVAVTSDSQLEQELDRASALGVDFFKTYVRLPDRMQKRIVDLRARSGEAGDLARDLSRASPSASMASSTCAAPAAAAIRRS